MIVALLGTTISPYLFFWQAGQEVEDQREKPGAKPLNSDPTQGRTEIQRIAIDTYIGMALSNPYDGPRVPGAVGRELPGVSGDIVDEAGRPVAVGEPGELRVRTPQMFSAYHGDAVATAASFDEDGRFRIFVKVAHISGTVSGPSSVNGSTVC